MGIKERAQQIFRAPINAWREAKAREEAKASAEVEQRVRSLFLTAENLLFRHSGDSTKIHFNPILELGLIKGKVNKTSYENIDGAAIFVDVFREERLREIFFDYIISQSEIDDVTIKAILISRDFWQKILVKPDTLPQVAAFGIKRIAKFNGLLKSFGYEESDLKTSQK